VFKVVQNAQRLASKAKAEKKKVRKGLLSVRSTTSEVGGNSQVGNLKRTTKDMASLPNEEYIDFLRDLRDILNWHKDYFLSKMTKFYNARPQRKLITFKS